jgi:hypothetical protein
VHASIERSTTNDENEQQFILEECPSGLRNRS